MDQHMARRDQVADRVSWINTGQQTCKANLLEFLRAFHDARVDRGFAYPDRSGSDQDNDAIPGAFEIVKTMRKESWSVVEKVVNIYLDQIAKGKAGWEWT